MQLISFFCIDYIKCKHSVSFSVYNICNYIYNESPKSSSRLVIPLIHTATWCVYNVMIYVFQTRSVHLNRMPKLLNPNVCIVEIACENYIGELILTFLRHSYVLFIYRKWSCKMFNAPHPSNFQSWPFQPGDRYSRDNHTLILLVYSTAPEDGGSGDGGGSDQQPQPPPPCPLTCELTNNTGYVVYSAIGSFYLPMLVMLFFYWRIYRAAVRTTRAINQGFKTTKGE